MGLPMCKPEVTNHTSAAARSFQRQDDKEYKSDADWAELRLPRKASDDAIWRYIFISKGETLIIEDYEWTLAFEGPNAKFPGVIKNPQIFIARPHSNKEDVFTVNAKSKIYPSLTITITPFSKAFGDKYRITSDYPSSRVVGGLDYGYRHIMACSGFIEKVRKSGKYCAIFWNLNPTVSIKYGAHRCEHTEMTLCETAARRVQAKIQELLKALPNSQSFGADEELPEALKSTYEEKICDLSDWIANRSTVSNSDKVFSPEGLRSLIKVSHGDIIREDDFNWTLTFFDDYMNVSSSQKKLRYHLVGLRDEELSTSTKAVDVRPLQNGCDFSFSTLGPPNSEMTLQGFHKKHKGVRIVCPLIVWHSPVPNFIVSLNPNHPFPKQLDGRRDESQEEYLQRVDQFAEEYAKEDQTLVFKWNVPWKFWTVADDTAERSLRRVVNSYLGGSVKLSIGCQEMISRQVKICLRDKGVDDAHSTWEAYVEKGIRTEVFGEYFANIRRLHTVREHLSCDLFGEDLIFLLGSFFFEVSTSREVTRCHMNDIDCK